MGKFIISLIISVLFVSSALCESKAGSTKSGSVKAKPKPEPKELVELDDTNWTQILEGDWFVAFYAPWCPACKDFLPEYRLFAQYNRGGDKFKVAAVDIQKYPGLSGRFLITALPTIYHIMDGTVRQYTGIRDRERMNRYLDMHGWDDVAPVSHWVHPNSAHMGLAGSFFELSMKLKDVHSWMTETKGVPTWVAYVLFGVATICLGGLIGIGLVLVIETVSGRRKQESFVFAADNGKKPSKSRSSSVGSASDSEERTKDTVEVNGISSSEGEEDPDEKKESGAESGGEMPARRRRVRRED